MLKLVTVTEWREHAGLNPAHSNQGRKILKQIEDAQLKDLRPLLGDKFFWDLIKDPTATANGSYPELLNETEYAFDNITCTSPGLKVVLFNFIEARYRYYCMDTDTPHGFAMPETERLNRSSETRNINIYNSLRALAEDYFEQISLFLSRKGNYTLWVGGSPEYDDGEGKIVINQVTLS